MNPTHNDAPPSLVLTAAQVAHLTGYTATRVRALTRIGRFPQPIDPDLHPRSWRWSRRLIERWADQGVGGAA
jgi:predicted DNA-binding transcriptional regulator AlpA